MGHSGFDYYGFMASIHRFMISALTAVLVTGTAPTWAATAAAKATRTPPANTGASEEPPDAAMGAELFYEVLLGEITTRAGDPATGFALMLEAARQSNDEKVYQRAADIALQARSGESALAAAQAWKAAWPQSREANRYVLQILVALNRISDSAVPLAQELTQSPPYAKTATLLALPQLYRRASDKALAAAIVEQALAADLRQPDTAPPAWVAIGRMRLLAEDVPGALQAAAQAQNTAPHYDGAALLALELLGRGEEAASTVVQTYFDAQPSPEMRMAYARVLIELQRNTEALQQLQSATAAQPDLTQSWLMQAALLLQEEKLAEAEAALQRFIALTTASAAPSTNGPRALTQAYLLYAQIAEKRGDPDNAEAWLNRIDHPQDLFSAQLQRASLLARQGKLTRARALVSTLPAATAEEEQLKLLAEVQILRDAHEYDQAYAVQTRVVAQSPDDNELIYDQAMLAEKAGKLDTMERLLRQIIARQPDFHHALNALGYSFADRGIRLAEAKTLIETALRHAPNDPFITDSLGWVEFRMGNRTQALRILETAFQKQPDAEIAAHLGEVLWSLGEQERAKEVWREGLRLKPNNDTLKSTIKRLGATL